MTTLDTRPPGLDVLFRPGDPLEVTLTWPEDALDGRTWTATLDQASLTVQVDEDVMTVSATAAQTTAAAEVGVFALTDTTGDDYDVLVGRWAASSSASGSHTAAVTVSDGSNPVTVTVDAAYADSVSFTQRREAQNHIYVPAQFGRRWATALDRSNGETILIDFWGDSITAGSTGISDPLVNAFPALVQDLLIPDYGDGGTGYVTVSNGTTTGTWTSQVGYLNVSSQATNTASVEWTVTGTDLAFVFHNAGVTGSWRYQIDGGSWTTVTTPSFFGLDPITERVTGLSSGSHLVRVEWVSGTVRLCGVEARNLSGVAPRRFCLGGRRASDFAAHAQAYKIVDYSSASTTLTADSTSPLFTGADRTLYVNQLSGTAAIPAGTTISSVASDGTTATASASTTGSGSNIEIALCYNDPQVESTGVPLNPRPPVMSFDRAGIGLPDVVVIAYAINDVSTQYRYNAESYVEGLSTILSAYHDVGAWAGQTQPDYVFLVNHRGVRDGPESEIEAMIGHTYALAASVNGAVVDMFRYWNYSLADANAASYFADSLHPSQTGHALIAQEIVRVLGMGR